MADKLSHKDRQRLYSYANPARSKQDFTDDELCQALREAQPDSSTQKGPTRESYQAFYDAHPAGRPHPYTIIRRFGKWSAALERAGFSAKSRARYRNRVDRDTCLYALDLSRQILGHYPSVMEYTDLWRYGSPDQNIPSLKEWGLPSEGTIRLRCGTWRKALSESREKSIEPDSTVKSKLSKTQ
jgi:hypothetical protein